MYDIYIYIYIYVAPPCWLMIVGEYTTQHIGDVLIVHELQLMKAGLYQPVERNDRLS